LVEDGVLQSALAAADTATLAQDKTQKKEEADPSEAEPTPEEDKVHTEEAAREGKESHHMEGEL
jgi:hypothetical protein